MAAVHLLAFIILYVALAKVSLRWPFPRWRIFLFALTNLLGVWHFFYSAVGMLKGLCLVGSYVTLVGFQYLIMRIFAQRKDGWFWLAFLTPLIILILVKYSHWLILPLWILPGKNFVSLLPGFYLGLSYLVFRTSYLTFEIRNGLVTKPGFWEYVSFSFFVPTMSVGPINSYSRFQKGFDPAGNQAELPLRRCCLRILVGWTKFLFLANLCNQLSYSGLLMDGHPHHWVDLAVAAIFYYLYLYCNFSGFCDMAIGTAGLIGFSVEENFNNPMAARNLKDFWNRWHITLSRWMRDVVFAPLSKYLVGLMGPANANHAIAIVITVVFLLVGIWHGVGWNFILFGATQGFGVVVTHYYTIGLKQRLGREGFKAYNENRWIHAAAVVVTFAYFSATTLFFANTFPQIKEILQSLR